MNLSPEQFNHYLKEGIIQVVGSVPSSLKDGQKIQIRHNTGASETITIDASKTPASAKLNAFSNGRTRALQAIQNKAAAVGVHVRVENEGYLSYEQGYKDGAKGVPAKTKDKSQPYTEGYIEGKEDKEKGRLKDKI